MIGAAIPRLERREVQVSVAVHVRQGWGIDLAPEEVDAGREAQDGLEILAIGQAIGVAVGALAALNVAIVRNPIQIAVAQRELALIGDAVLIAIEAPGGRHIALVGRGVSVAVCLALIGDAVPVTVRAFSRLDFAGVEDPIQVAVKAPELALIGDAVSVAVA